MLRRVAVLLLLPVGAVAAAPVPKDTDAGRMTRIYGAVYDPEKGTAFKPSGDSLRIGLPQEQRLLGPWSKVYNAPRVWRVVRGDFTVTVRVSFPIRRAIPARHDEAPESRAGGGLVIWADNDNFLTATRDEREYDGEPGEFFRAEQRNKGAARGYSEYATPGQAGYLRVQRKGKDLWARYSTDGKKWKLLCVYDAEWGDEVKVGVFAENSFKDTFEATFDEYTLTVEK